ncbi:6-phosphofructo-2-kinase/fructose-2,6-bisphosphatase-like protein isoform X1, partial [Tanacetum coccineum]
RIPGHWVQPPPPANFGAVFQCYSFPVCFKPPNPAFAMAVISPCGFRHGESRDNLRGRIGGDLVLSGKGELDAKKLANFVKKRFQNERAASVIFPLNLLVWTSTLQRTNLTANLIAGFPKVQWRALDEINASYVME